MARRRLQLRGNLYSQNSFWKLRWREDQINSSGVLTRGWSKPVWIGPSAGRERMTEKEARRIAWDNFLSRLDQNNHTPMSVVTLNEFIDRKFVPEHVALLKKSGQQHYGVRSGTTGEYGGMFRHILAAFGKQRLRDITASDIQRVVSGLMVQGKKAMQPASVQTRLHVKNAMSAIFEHAIAIDWYTGNNPAKKVRLPQMSRKPSHALSLDQVRSLLPVLPSPAREMCLCSILTSMNAAELCGLVWRNVNLTPDWITAGGHSLPPWSLHVCQQWRLGEYTSVKSPARNRNLPLAEPLAAALLTLKARPRHTGPDDPVFVSRTGRPQDVHNMANRVLRPIGKQLNMPWLSWHCLRRTTATVADQLGAGTSDRKAILGHTTNSMASRYVQPADHDRVRKFLDDIATLIMPTAKGPIQ